MDFEDVLGRRRMVRHYSGDPVSLQQVRRIVLAATRAPSAGFAQGQSFVVITDPELRGAVARLAGEHRYAVRGYEPWISSAAALICLCTSREAYRRRYAERDKPAGGGPDSWPVPYWYVDAGCSLMLLLLAAVNEGLAAGFLGAHRLPGLSSLLGLPGDVEPVGIVSVGRAATDRRSGSVGRGRKREEELVHWERWGGRFAHATGSA